MAKNKDGKSFNRTGIFDFKNMKIVYKDKNGEFEFDINSKLREFDGEDISLTVTTDTNPSHTQPKE